MVCMSVQSDGLFIQQTNLRLKETPLQAPADHKPRWFLHIFLQISGHGQALEIYSEPAKPCKSLSGEVSPTQD